jgi:Meiotically up-regulated gene 113
LWAERRVGRLPCTNDASVVESGGAEDVKIGRAGDVEARRGQFKTGNPQDMTVIDVVEADNAQPIEAILHRLHYSKRVRGEFFALTPDEAEEAGRQAREIRDLYLPMQQKVRRLAQSPCGSPPLPRTDDRRALRRMVIEKREAKYRAEFEYATSRSSRTRPRSGPRRESRGTAAGKRW